MLLISQVYIALYRTDIINVPSNRPAGMGMAGVVKKDKSYLIGEKIKLFQASTYPALADPSTVDASPLSASNLAPARHAGPIVSSSQSKDTKRYDEVLGLDLNFLLPLPITKQLPASISLQKRAVETSYQLFVTVVYGRQLHTLHQPFPVRIKRYDKLSTFGQFHIPLKGNIVSPDHLVEFEYSIPQSSFGPRDSIVSYVKISPNLDLGAKARRIKLQRLSVQVVEVITYNTNESNSATFIAAASTSSALSPSSSSSSSSTALALSHTASINTNHSVVSLAASSASVYNSGIPGSSTASFSDIGGSGDGPVERRRKLCKATNQLDIKLPEAGYRCEITMDFPVTDLREPKDTSGAVVPQTRSDIPAAAYNNGFSTTAPLYKVDYLLVFKAKFSHSKDILIEQPITVTPFDHVMCTSLMKSIKDAVDEANDAYQDEEEYLLNSTARYTKNGGPAGAGAGPDASSASRQQQQPHYKTTNKKTGATKKVFVPIVYRPNDTNSYMAYGVQPVGVGLLGGTSKPMLLIR